MFGLFRRASTETRSAEIDVGSLFAAAFQFEGGSYSWARSPALLVASLSLPDATGDSTGVLVTESRRLGRTVPLLLAYRNVIESGILTGAPEAPEFGEGVTERVATAAAELWIDAHDCDRERDLLDRVVMDGELLLVDTGEIVPTDNFTPVLAGPKWDRRVVGYSIGKSKSARMADLHYLGDRPVGASRALPWIAPALPPAASLLNARTGAGHALGALAKIGAVIANASPDRVAASAGHRSGVAGNDADGEPRRALTTMPVGSVPFMRPGESVDRIAAGPDKEARDYESVLERDVAAALNLPLSELRSDYSTGSFSNLRMAWVDAERELLRRRSWWHRHYRLPRWRELLSDAFADGKLPRMRVEDMEALKRPRWKGPQRQPPQPEKEAQSLAMLVKAGILDPATAADKLEN